METILLVLAVSLDSFVASIAYGTKGIKMPILSIWIVNIISSLFLGISIFLGLLIQRFIPNNITRILSFILLFILGIYFLFEGLVKNYLDSQKYFKKELKLSLFDISFVINVYIDELKADLDKSKNLDSREAIYLGTALALDSLAIGFGNSFGNISPFYAMVLSAIVGVIGVSGGLFLGEKILRKSTINLSWLSGFILIILAFLKLK